ncbi:MAG: DEAD/DEAH box helicase family protein [Mycobacteriales bacterium]
MFEASGSETHLTNGFAPEARARRVFAGPRPETLARWLRDAEADPAAPTWRAKVKKMPQLRTEGLRPPQIEAVTGIERSVAEQRFDRSLVQMATGAGKTYTAVPSSYRLLKHGGFRRVLFLVDRNNLGDRRCASSNGILLLETGQWRRLIPTPGRAPPALPTRIAVSVRPPASICIGCRRVDAPQVCPQGCDERAIDLVFGDAYDAAMTRLEQDRRDIRLLRGLLRSAAAPPAPREPGHDRSDAELEQAHRALQAEARKALRHDDTDSDRSAAATEDVLRITAGYRPVCGWIEAPQPCLGICIFRSVEMVPALDYDNARELRQQVRRRLDKLSAVARQLSWSTPRAGGWEHTRAALASRAQQALAVAGTDILS